MATIRLKRGTAAPTGLTLAEPAFDYANNRLYVGVTASSIWVGAEIDNNTSLGTSQIKIPTQFAVKTYVDNNVAAGAVSSINGLTGAVFIGTGTGINLAAAGKGITLTNTGVQSLAGTANQITVSGATGSVTLSLPSAVTMPGSLTVTGDLTVNGTTTYVNSTVTEIADPIITLGWTGGVNPMPTDDNKDRGIAFKYNSSGGKTGFFGYDDSTGYFTFVPNAGITGEVVGGVVGTANFNGVISTTNTALTLTGNAANPATIVITGHPTVGGSETIVLNTGSVAISNSSGAGILRINDTAGNYDAVITPTTYTNERTFTLPDHSGTVVAPSDLGTSGYILKANGTTSQPTWINPNAAGFTANMATNIAGGAAGSLPYNTAANTTTFLSIGSASTILLSNGSAPSWINPNSAGFTAFTSTNNLMTSDTSDTTCFVAFVNAATDTNQALKYNSSLSYNAVTNYLEANIDGGSY